MAGVTGRDIKGLAFAKANSWGTAASVTKGTYFQSDGGMMYQPQRVNDDAFGQAFLSEGDYGNLTAQKLKWPGRARGESNEFVLEALAMGSPQAVTLSSSASGQTTSWQHIMDLAPSIDGLVITAAVDMGLFVNELTSGKVHGFSWQVGDNGVMDEEFQILGSTATNISSTNINSTVYAAAFPALNDRVFQKQGTFRMNVQSAGSLTSTNKVDAEQIQFEFQRPQDAPHVFAQDYVYEPADNGFPEVTLTVNYPRMNTVSANSLYQALRSDTTFKADWTFLGAYINSTDQYKQLFQFPCLELDEWSVKLQGPNQLKPVAKFTAKQAATSPTGMSFIRPFRLTRVMVNSTVAF
jgi:hypothetical protein